MSIEADATQYDDRALGRNLDVSLVADDFFGTLPAQEGWTERMIANLPTLQLGAKDTAGHVFFVHRLQALLRVWGEINGVIAAACIPITGTFDAPTGVAVAAVQAHKGLVQDQVCGPKTWSVLIAGNPA